MRAEREIEAIYKAGKVVEFYKGQKTKKYKRIEAIEKAIEMQERRLGCSMLEYIERQILS